MAIHLLLRLSVMLAASFLGWELGAVLDKWFALAARLHLTAGTLRLVTTSCAAVLGFILAPTLTTASSRAAERQLQHVPARSLIMGVVGLSVGLVMAALGAVPLSMLPGAWGDVLPFVAALALGTLGTSLAVARDREILAAVGLILGHDALKRKRSLILLDTSVIIDGRIADISETGFITGTLMLSRFVLDELQHIADSPDPLRRRRGRRGLDVLDRLRKNAQVALEVSDVDPVDVQDVDSKLVTIAQNLDCPILTNDYNLNRVAALQKIKVLNINELANAVKSVVLPGEVIAVQIIQEGKEAGQGVGYLDDGTMVVVEDGRRWMSTTCEVLVTRVLQTVAGKMIFAQVSKES